ncbi:unnamed protein product [Rotaria socialis]|uniref:Secreted protein n=1 Tax=Rotaria socialis TaxID=392032 RepID=A0A818GMZ0_9BILA|nr:unnamed protein product [Rotaria socialis]CAF4355845.1 unnamed protein product [Rotaria socialis]CAF4372172.1 unnamed protein product [Rotaria socialis]CAF4485276.1 unnamed protein product [Rotaria socialis]CAF4545181.1 unnamed protein product [Rotaria socialis]
MQSVTLVSCLILAVAILSVNTHPNRDRHHHSSSFDNSTSSSNGTFSSHGNHSHHEHSGESSHHRGNRSRSKETVTLVAKSTTHQLPRAFGGNVGR